MKKITDTFVLPAPDCPVRASTVPAAKGKTPTIASLQYELLTAKPYELTHEDLIFETHVRRAGMSASEARSQQAAIRAALFAKPQACMRASPLPKQYGWGVHYDSEGRLALVAADSEEYRRFTAGEAPGVTLVAALRSKRSG